MYADDLSEFWLLLLPAIYLPPINHLYPWGAFNLLPQHKRLSVMLSLICRWWRVCVLCLRIWLRGNDWCGRCMLLGFHKNVAAFSMLRCIDNVDQYSTHTVKLTSSVTYSNVWTCPGSIWGDNQRECEPSSAVATHSLAAVKPLVLRHALFLSCCIPQATP